MFVGLVFNILRDDDVNRYDRMMFILLFCYYFYLSFSSNMSVCCVCLLGWNGRLRRCFRVLLS